MLMSQVAKLWIAPGDIVVDSTFGKGVFWRNLPDLPSHKHDLHTVDGVELGALPHEDASVDALVLDPPYRPSHGSKNFSSGLSEAYGLGGGDVDTIEDVLTLYRRGISEAFRVLRSGGRILVKCADMSYDHRLHLVTYDVLRILTEAGFDLADQFVLGNKTQARSTAWKKQERARRSHSVLWVGLKP